MSQDPDGTMNDLLAETADSALVATNPAEWPDAKALCLQVGANTRNLPGYRLGMAAASTLDLAYEFAVMAHLVEMLRQSDAGVAMLAIPSIEALRDICLAEGLRRGVMLTLGDDIDSLSLALQIMEEFIAAFTPQFALSGGARWW